MLESFKHPRVRDLAWIIGSPVLLQPGQPSMPAVSDSECNALFTEALPYLEELDAEPKPLLDFLEQLPGHRVGRYFEALTNYWLRNISSHDVVTNNLQLIRGKQTLGEIDFLFREKNKLVHWEAAVKYYLQLEPGCEPVEYIGPNTADNLASKLHRLFDKQLPRSTPENLTRALGPLDGVEDVNRRAFVKGWLFYRHSDAVNRREPPILNPSHLKGFWLRHGEEPLPRSDSKARWSLLAKPHWLAPKLCNNPETLITQKQLEQLLSNHFASRQSPLLIAKLEPFESGFQEVCRGFVVPPVWPHLSPAPKPLS